MQAAIEAVVELPMGEPTRLQPVIEAGASGIFRMVRAAAVIIGAFGFLIWGASASVHDSAGTDGGLLVAATAFTIAALCGLAARTIKVFATADLVGSVGPFGGVRTCPRSDLSEVRTVWHWWQGRGAGFWVFPTLHFRRRDTSDAIVILALLYKTDELRALGQYLGLPIDLDRPTEDKAA